MKRSRYAPEQIAFALRQAENGTPVVEVCRNDLPPETRSRKNVRNWAKGGGTDGKAEAYTPEQVIKKLREAEAAMAEGGTVAQASRKIGVTEQTFYRWRAEYGGLRIDQARRLKQLETENGRLRRAVADLTLDNQILKEAAQGNF